MRSLIERTLMGKMDPDGVDNISLLFITRKFPPTKGGMEKVAYDLFKNLRTRIDVDLTKSPQKLVGPLAIMYLFIIGLFKIIRKNHDLIFLQDGMLSPLVILGRIFNKPVIINAHGLDVIYPRFFYQLMIRFFFTKADKIICVSSSTQKECWKRGATEAQTTVIHNGIDTEDWDTMSLQVEEKGKGRYSNVDTILFVGRLVERKGIHWFIRYSLPLIVAKKENLRMVIIGDGPFRNVLIDIIKKYGNRMDIQLLGRVDDEVLIKNYLNASVLVYPNIPVPGDIEGFGICNIEAPYFGVPVVASEIDGITDAIIDGVTGILVDPLDEVGFANAILSILNEEIDFDPILMKSEIVTRFHWKGISGKYIREFEKLKSRIA